MPFDSAAVSASAPPAHRMEDVVYRHAVSTGVLFLTAGALPHDTLGMETARFILRIAGAGFGLYTLTMMILLVTGAIIRHFGTQERPSPTVRVPEPAVRAQASGRRNVT